MICNSHSSWVLSLNLIDIFFYPFLSATADEYNIQLSRSSQGAQVNVAIFTSIHNFLLKGQILISFIVILCIHPTSFLFSFGSSPTTVKVNRVCMVSFRDGSGIIRLKKLNKITYWNQELFAGELPVQPVVLSVNETLKGKFTEWLKGLHPPSPPTSMAHYGLYSSPHDGEVAAYSSLPSPSTHTLWFSSSHQHCIIQL